MRTIRTILALEPGLLADSLRCAFSDEPDIEIACEAADAVGLLLAAREHEPSVVVLTVSDRGRLPAVGTHLLAEFPELLIVGINTRTETAYTFRNAVQTEQHSLGSFDQVVARLRSAATYPECNSDLPNGTTFNDGAADTARTHC